MELLIILGLLYLLIKSRKEARNGTAETPIPKVHKEPYKKMEYFFTRAERFFLRSFVMLFVIWKFMFSPRLGWLI